MTLPDASPRPNTPIEWWFFQGRYEASRRQTCFMLALFRLSRKTTARKGKDGHDHMLLTAVLDADADRHRCASRIEPSLARSFQQRVHTGSVATLDTRILRAYASETASWGPPRPIEVRHDPVTVRAEPLRISWGDLEIRQDAKAVRLRFTLPGDREPCELALCPEGARFHSDAVGPAAAPMTYDACPRLRLAGRAHGETVRGEAWFDHQWGDRGWFGDGPGQTGVLGWEWFGLNLNDGTDLIFMTHRDLRTRRVCARQAVLFEPDREPRHGFSFRAKPLALWESPATRIVYPVTWSLCIPELDAALLFRPLVPDQEIPVFGPLRAVWEGAGTVSGTLQGHAVAGCGRMEIQGYGYILDFQKYLDAFAVRTDRRLARHFPRRHTLRTVRSCVGPARWRHDPAAMTAVLANPVWDLLDRRGKRWRPAFGLLLLEALGVSSRRYESLFTLIPELSHTGSLIIDDIQDASLLRRGDPCIHHRYGIPTAISAANTVYFLPLLQLADHPHLTETQRLACYQSVVRQYVRAHFGQGLDVYWSEHLTPEKLDRWLADGLPEKVLQMYAQKTAGMIEGLAEQACIVAKADNACKAACIAFAGSFGVAFQIVDDVHNFDASPRWGKTRGEDLADGKLTYAILRALDRLGSDERLRLKTILCTPEIRKNPEALKEGIDLIRRSGALEHCRGEARTLVERSWKKLSAVLPPSEPKILLRALCTHLLEMDNGPFREVRAPATGK